MADDLEKFSMGEVANPDKVNENFEYLDNKCDTLTKNLASVKVSIQSSVKNSFNTILGITVEEKTGQDGQSTYELTTTDGTEFKEFLNGKTLLEWFNEQKATIDKFAQLKKDYDSRSYVKTSTTTPTVEDETLRGTPQTEDSVTTYPYNLVNRNSNSTSSVKSQQKTLKTENYHYITKEYFSESEEKERIATYKELHARIPARLTNTKGATTVQFVVNLPKNMFTTIYDYSFIPVKSKSGETISYRTVTITAFDTEKITGNVVIPKGYSTDFDIIFNVGGV